MPAPRAGLRPPAFSSGCPMPRFHAALGTMSPAKRNCVQVTKLKKSRDADTPRANILTMSSDLKPTMTAEKRYSRIVENTSCDLSEHRKAITTENTEGHGKIPQRVRIHFSRDQLAFGDPTSSFSIMNALHRDPKNSCPDPSVSRAVGAASTF